MSWEGDKLERKEEAKYLVNYINRKFYTQKEDSLSINLNAVWGHGKTYFLTNLKEDLDREGHPVVYYDAWQNDFSNEALVSFISEVSEMLSNSLGNDPKIGDKVATFKAKGLNLIKSSLPIILSALVKHLLKTDIQTILNGDEESEKDSDDGNVLEDTITKLTSSAATSLLAEHKATKKSIIEFKKSLNDIVKELEKPDGKLIDRHLPIYVLIDELDRCRPTFAIELLESVKHLFGVYGIVFITATNTKELQSSIKAIYGSEFSASSYLHRFFDLEYTFKTPDLQGVSELLLKDFRHSNKLYSYDLAASESDSIVRMVTIFCQFFKVSLRDLEQLIIALEACVYSYSKILELPLLLFLLILKQRNEHDYLQLLENSNGDSAFIDYFKKGNFDRTVTIPTFSNVRDQYAYDTKDSISIPDVIAVYGRAKGKAINEIPYEENNYQIIQFINTNLRNSLSGAKLSRKRNTITYSEYFEMVKQAGRFTESIK